MAATKKTAAKQALTGTAAHKPAASAMSSGREMKDGRIAATKKGRAAANGAPNAAPRVDINDLSSTQPLATVKTRFSEMVDRVDSTHDRITITRNGVPIAVLVSHDDLESMVETIDILSDPEAMAAIAEAKGESGGLDEDEIRRRYLE